MRKIILKCAKYYWTYIGSLIFRSNRPESVPPPRILITRFDKLGDFFLQIPFLQQLVKKRIEIVLIGPSINKEIIDHLGIPITFIPFDNRSLKAFSEILKYVRNTAFSHSFNLSMNIWGAFLVNQSKSAHKIGLLQEREHYVYKGSKLFYDKILSYPPNTHNFEVLKEVFREIDGTNNFVPSIETAVSDDDWIIIHPFASRPAKQWPRYFSLIETLIGLNYKVKIIGTSEEYEGYVLPERFVNNPFVSRTILSSVKDLMSHIDRCRAFIGNDSGPAHYAALIGKPVIVIWGPGLFDRIHQVGKNVRFCIYPIDCRPCRQTIRDCRHGENICLQNVTVEMAMGEFEISDVKCA